MSTREDRESELGRFLNDASSNLSKSTPVSHLSADVPSSFYTADTVGDQAVKYTQDAESNQNEHRSGPYSHAWQPLTPQKRNSKPGKKPEEKAQELAPEFYIGGEQKSSENSFNDQDKVLFHLGSKQMIHGEVGMEGIRRGSEVQLKEHTVNDTKERADNPNLAGGDIENIASHRLGYNHPSKPVHKVILPSKKEVPHTTRVQIDHQPHEMFVELDELCINNESDEWEWKEKARWIKFEEDVEEGAERWGRPHVASLSFHSLLELRRCIELGALHIDMDAICLGDIAQQMVQQLVSTNQIHPDLSDMMTRALLSRHQHVGEGRNGSMRRNKSIFNLYGLDKNFRSGSMDTGSGFFSRSPANASTSKLALGGAGSMGKPSPLARVANENIRMSMEKMNKSEVKSSDKKNLYVLQPGAAPPSSMASIPKSMGSTGSNRSNERRILRKIPTDAEATMVLVGGVDFLDKTVMSFVRLAEGTMIDEMMEVPLPVRFLFLVMGPTHATIDYREVGRSISTLMANKFFVDIAYRAECRDDLLNAINKFLDNSIVLPPCEWDKNTLLPILDMAKKTLAKRRQSQIEKKLSTTQPIADQLDGKDMLLKLDPLRRTGRLFGGLINDIKRRYPWYLSDFKDGLNMHCFATFFFIYFACLAPAITFGGLLSDKTDKWMGVSEMLVMTSAGGIFFALFAGQPITIVGATGPLLLFEESLFGIATSMGLEYMPLRFWIGCWVALFTLLMVMFEGCFMVRYFTRFTEEIFSALISLLFIFEVFNKLFKNITMGYSNQTSTYIVPFEMSKPNTALLSMILTFGTFLIAQELKKFRNSNYLGRGIRRAIGDFGIPIAIATMVLIDFLIEETYTEKLDVPDGMTPTASDKRGWLISPFGLKSVMPIWGICAASVPALLLFILIFMETQITSMIVNKSERKLRKGSGYHLDYLLISIMNCFAGVFGLPMVTAAAVRSVSHASALSVFSRTTAPGVKPELDFVREQRVTAVCVHIMVGVSALMGPILRNVPLAVLFGVFLYMGLASMAGVQLFERIPLIFMPSKHHPMVGYVKRVKTLKIHAFTILQVMMLVIMWVVKSSAASLAFPFMLVMMAPLRLFILPKFFSDKELQELDGDKPQSTIEDAQDEPDFYEQTHMAE